MKKVLLLACFSIASLFFHTQVLAQACSGTVSNGQNLVINGDFSQGYAGWTHDAGYSKYTYCSNCYSGPGDIYAHDDQDDFNPGAFPRFNDHSSSSDNMMLMVDGVCTNGINLWSQSGIPIVTNTNYFFSVWIAPLIGAPKAQGTLNFNINGTDLVGNITTNGVVGSWVKVTGNWFSGASTTATISIQNTNTTGCNDGVDFAIDDISFSPGCEFGTLGPLPNLGSDISICGKTLPFNINPNFNTATQNSANVSYTWYKDGVQMSQGFGSAFYNFPVNAPGTYSVCVDSSGSCPRTDIMVVTNSYSIDLGPDQTLCDPIVAALDAVYTGPGVTYQWFNGGSAISGQTSQTYTVNVPGTYSVSVHDPSCGDKSDTIDITTLAAVPQNGTFCPTFGPGTASLSVTGPGKYKWWTAATGGTVLATGPNYTTPVLAAPGPYIYYVQDTSTFKVTAGPPATGHGMVNPQGMNPSNSPLDPNQSQPDKLIFNALTDFRLDSITVLPYNYYCPGPAPYTGGNPNKVSFIVFDSIGGVVGTSPLFTAQCQGEGQPAPPLKVPVGINIPQGNGYQLRLNTGSTQFAIYLNTTNGGNPPVPELYHYPTTYSGAVEFVGNDPKSYSLYYSPDAFPGYFDWKITKGVNCQRVPVYATLDCPSCLSSVAPTSISSSSTTFCKGTLSTIDLTVTGGSGDSLILYKGSCGGIRVDSNATGAAFVNIPVPTTTTTYFARWESALNCKSSCVSVTVTPVDIPSIPNAGPNQTICNVTTATLNADRPVFGTGIWSVVSGTGSISNSFDSLSTVTGIGAGDLVLQWKVSNNPCPADSAEVTIARIAPDAPTSLTPDVSSFCQGTISSITLTAAGGSGGIGGQLMLYSGSCGGTKVDSNTTGNPITIPAPSATTTYFARWETTSNCNSACVSATVTPVDNPSVSSPGTSQNICNSTTTTLNADRPLIGTGAWSVVSGTGTVTTPGDSLSGVTGLVAGDLVLEWIVSNSPCPASSNQITIHKDVLANPVITGTTFDTCALTSGVAYSTTVDNSPGSSYNWTSTGTINISSQSTNTATVGVGASGGNLTVTETLGACVLSDTRAITISPDVSPAVAGADQTPCVNNTVLNAVSPAVGTGQWSVNSGTGVFANANNPQSAVSGMANGLNIYTWTVNGCGGPLSDDMEVMVTTSAMVLDATGPTDTTCVGTPRDLNLTVNGGSGQYKYYWTSSNSSFTSTTSNVTVTVTPQTDPVIYYVYAEDTVNAGCLSNADSVIIHTVAAQVLMSNNFLTPNLDGMNERLIITDINTSQAILPGSTLEVYNRWGERVYKATSYDNTWGATGLTDGIYYYYLKAGCGNGEFRGWIQVIGSTASK
jgi:hypothetical protein